MKNESEEIGIWRSIATAPKDGTEIMVLLECAGVAMVHIAWYRSHEEWENSGKNLGWDTPEEWEGWWSYTHNSVSQDKLDGDLMPKYWHPLLREKEQVEAEGMTEQEAKIAFCSECRYGLHRLGKLQCVNPNNLGTWYRRDEPRVEAYILNDENKCTWFEKEKR